MKILEALNFGDVYSNRYLVPFFAESEDWEEATADESMVEQPSIFDDTNTVESPSIEEFIESEEDSNE